MNLKPSSASGLKPLLVSPREAERAIDVGHTKLYALIKAGKLETVKIGSATKITVRSLEALARSGA